MSGIDSAPFFHRCPTSSMAMRGGTGLIYGGRKAWGARAGAAWGAAARAIGGGEGRIRVAVRSPTRAAELTRDWKLTGGMEEKLLVRGGRPCSRPFMRFWSEIWSARSWKLRV